MYLNKETLPPMECITYSDRFCGRSAELDHAGFWLCEDHALAAQIGRKRTKALAAIRSTTPTGIYIMRTPYNTLKIGATASLARRLSDLHRDFRLGPRERLELLAFDPDCTYRDEAVLHERYWDFLLTDREGEQFEDVPEIRAEAVAIGVDDSAVVPLGEYHRVEFSGNAKHKRLYLPPTMREIRA